MTKAKTLRIVGIVSAVLAFIWAILFWGPWIIAWWITKAAPQIASLGIIGGADGPTTVYVTTAVIMTNGIWGEIFYWLEMLMPLILGGISITCFVWRKKTLKKGE